MRLEKKGIPTVTSTNTGFRSEIYNHAKLSGFPYLPIVVLDYDTEHAFLVKRAVDKVLDKFVEGLTTPAEELQKNV